ncbi:MAG TPA: hypothetical protein VKX46_02790 [Ktedonobacteraceae bacterium]|nr:hypothetical protein [Ktedonobacteraceae bacterium]
MIRMRKNALIGQYLECSKEQMGGPARREIDPVTSMMKRLRGRNLAHPGCLIGITAGLTFGIILAGILASVFNVELSTILYIWLGLTVALGAIGWIVGARLTSRFPAEPEADEQPPAVQPESSATAEQVASQTPDTV